MIELGERYVGFCEQMVNYNTRLRFDNDSLREQLRGKDIEANRMQSEINMLKMHLESIKYEKEQIEKSLEKLQDAYVAEIGQDPIDSKINWQEGVM